MVEFHSSRSSQASYTETWWTYFSAAVHDWYTRTLALLTDLGSGELKGMAWTITA